jgi:L-methionine (R)-S-oxide reductase
MKDESPEDESDSPDADTVSEEALFRQIESIVADADKSEEDALEQVCTLLLDELPDYNWVGFYYIDPGRPRELTQGPYAGEPQERTTIPFGEGVCGRAAEVAHPDMRAEIAAPLLDGETVVGVLNVESIRPAVFGQRDRAFLRSVGELTGPLVARWTRQL